MKILLQEIVHQSQKMGKGNIYFAKRTDTVEPSIFPVEIQYPLGGVCRTLFQQPFVIPGFRSAADMVDVGVGRLSELHSLAPIAP